MVLSLFFLVCLGSAGGEGISDWFSLMPALIISPTTPEETTIRGLLVVRGKADQ